MSTTSRKFFVKGRERGCARAARFELASFSPNSGKFRLLLALSRGANQIPAYNGLATRDSELGTFAKPSPIDSNDYTRVSFLRARVVKARRKYRIGAVETLPAENNGDKSASRFASDAASPVETLHPLNSYARAKFQPIGRRSFSANATARFCGFARLAFRTYGRFTRNAARLRSHSSVTTGSANRKCRHYALSRVRAISRRPTATFVGRKPICDRARRFVVAYFFRRCSTCQENNNFCRVGRPRHLDSAINALSR